MSKYYRPLVQLDPVRPEGAVGMGWGWFSHVEVLQRGRPPFLMAAQDIPEAWRQRICGTRASCAGLHFDQPRIMGIVNVTPDSFSDGGQFGAAGDAVQRAVQLRDLGADIIDIGGESTRPGAELIEPDVEIARTAPVVSGLRESVSTLPISIDTRKAAVGQAALRAGATLVNDVSGFTWDPGLLEICVAHQVPVCVMHAQGDPKTMQKNPFYEDVLLDVYDFLAERIGTLVGAGIARDQIIVDPGIGFGKTLAHNLAILQRISLFHGLGVPILLGASRKRFIGTIGKAAQADARGPGSVAVALAALAQGVQIVRVHDVAETRQAIALWQAVTLGRH